MATKTELPQSFEYEHCDIPDGVSIAEWRVRTVHPPRKAQVAGGIFAVLATFGPIALAVRGKRSR